MLAGVLSFTSCEKDDDSNPVLQKPTEFKLNTPSLANQVIDLDKSENVILTCTQPNYGFPIVAKYAVQVSLDEDFAAFRELDKNDYDTVRIDAKSSDIAVKLSELIAEKGQTEAGSPFVQAVYFRLRAYVTPLGSEDIIEGTEILSNVVKFNNMRFSWTLKPLELPETLYLTGAFSGWDWSKSVAMAQLHSNKYVLWHPVYIDGDGIKFNLNKEWDGNEQGFTNDYVTIDDVAGAGVKDNGGNLAVDNPGWYIVVISTRIEGRSYYYHVSLQAPDFWMIGTVTDMGDNAWDAMLNGWKLTVPTTADGDFVSPAFAANAASDSGVRCYAMVKGWDFASQQYIDPTWWKSEFMVFDGKIVYRGAGDDQERVAGSAGQKLYLNFSTDTGKIE